jgi:hypothetical protein
LPLANMLIQSEAKNLFILKASGRHSKAGRGI